MNDWYINLAVGVIIQMVRDGTIRGKYRSALLKIFREIARAFAQDTEFINAVKLVQGK